MLNIGTLNVRGCNDQLKKSTLIEDCVKYQLDVLAITETHTTGSEELDRNRKYTIYTVNEENNHHHGVGFVIKTSLNPTFKKISNRICKATIKQDDRKIHFIATYAHTLQTAERNPEKREEMYEILDTETKKIPNRDYCFILGDFNAKVGRNWWEYPDNLGKYGKGVKNNNGKYLLEYCANNDMIITNTMFKHNAAHITTWTAPYRDFMQNGEPRRNPIRNQIDFIIMKNIHKGSVKDSRSYAGIKTETDKSIYLIEMVSRNRFARKGLSQRIKGKLDRKLIFSNFVHFG